MEVIHCRGGRSVLILGTTVVASRVGSSREAVELIRRAQHGVLGQCFEVLQPFRAPAGGLGAKSFTNRSAWTRRIVRHFLTWWQRRGRAPGRGSLCASLFTAFLRNSTIVIAPASLIHSVIRWARVPAPSQARAIGGKPHFRGLSSSDLDPQQLERGSPLIK